MATSNLSAGSSWRLPTAFSVNKIIVPTRFRAVEWEESERCNLAGCENDRPSLRALAAIQNPTSEMLIDHWDPQDIQLRDELGRQHTVTPEQVFLTSGAMGAIRYAFELFGGQARQIGLLRPDWPGFRYFAERTKVPITWLEHIDFPFQFEVDDVIRFITDNAIDFTIISNPSAVTGRFWSRNEVSRLVSACPNTMFIIDEADTIYPDLSGASLVNEHDNVLFLESFSKFYGLSGLRIGYLVTPARYSAAFEHTIDPIELASLAIIAAREALADVDYQKQTQREVEQNLEKVIRAVAAGPYRLSPQSRCFAAYLHGDPSAPDPLVALGERGVDLVPAEWFSLDRGGRLNLRNPRSIDRLVAALSDIAQQHGAAA